MESLPPLPWRPNLAARNNNNKVCKQYVAKFLYDAHVSYYLSNHDRDKY